MGSVSRRRREGQEAVYPVAVMLVRCPRCGAVPGDKCLETWGGETFPRKTPHAPRIEESKPKIGKANR